MSSPHIFNQDVAERLEAVYRTPEMIAQRRATLRALAPKRGDHILDVGAGPGLLVLDLAPAVTPEGHVTGIDVSPDMLAIARHHRERTPHADHITFRYGDAIDLPFADASFDALTSTQVYEYVEDVDRALAEAYRVLRADRRLLVLDTDWDSLVWHTHDRDLMRRITAAWTQRFADPHLPTTLRRRLQRVGFSVEAAEVFPVLNANFDLDTYSASHIPIISEFVQNRGISHEDAATWANDLHERIKADEYFFSLSRYLFIARKP